MQSLSVTHLSCVTGGNALSRHHPRLPLLLLVLSLGACPAAAPRGPLTDAEVRDLGLKEGFAGRASVHEGQWSGIVCTGGCSNTALGADLVALALPEGLAWPTSAGMQDASACQVRVGEESALLFGTRLDALATALPEVGRLRLDEERYGLALPPGSYTLVLVRDGCLACVLEQLDADGRMVCAPADVLREQVTRVNILEGLCTG